MKKKIVLLFSILIIILTVISVIFVVGCKKKENSSLRIGVSSFGTNYNAYYYTSVEEERIVDLLNIKLFSTDDSDAASTLEQISSTQYKFTIDESIISSDGVVELSYKDLLFDLYYLLDPSYTGSCKLNTLPIEGLNEYRDGVIDALTYSTSEMNSRLDSLFISGIKVSGSSIVIKTTRELTEEELDILNIYILPLNYFGNSLKFNLKSNKFGFDKGTLKTLTSAKGLGKYYISDVTSTKITLKRNEVYFGELAKIKTVVLVLITEKITNSKGYRTSGGDKFLLIYEDEIDIAIVENTEETIDEIKRYNFNEKINGNIISTINLADSEDYIYIYSTKRIRSSVKKISFSCENDVYNVLDEIKFR